MPLLFVGMLRAMLECCVPEQISIHEGPDCLQQISFLAMIRDAV